MLLRSATASPARADEHDEELAAKLYILRFTPAGNNARAKIMRERSAVPVALALLRADLKETQRATATNNMYQVGINLLIY